MVPSLMQSQISFTASFCFNVMLSLRTSSSQHLCFAGFPIWSYCWISEYSYRLWVVPVWIPGFKEPPVCPAYSAVPFAHLKYHLHQENLTALCISRYPHKAYLDIFSLQGPHSPGSSPSGTRVQHQQFGTSSPPQSSLSGVAGGALSFLQAPVSAFIFKVDVQPL